ncbi:hypothetical protein E8E12_011693 [Didymella heteroderae]|uniref:Cytochrome P450 n=1 Tax=Didymella heteroderae TaxID=1769908 RepID=A0A9P4X303_9PLEO|nr:hypothetical protein E8E12_011693 [Didymella heteroderae]
MTAGYSGKENESMELSIENQVANLVKLLKSAYTSNDVDYCPVDLAQKLQYFTLDVISDLAFGKPLGYLFSKRIVAERFDVSARSQRDMLASFIRHGLNEAEASGEALLQVVAGADTTATGLKTIMLSLMTNPAVYKRLQAEIEDGVLKGTVSLPIKDSEARQLPYLQAVIKEGLRIRSPAGGAFYKMVPSGGDTINGFFVPEGTQIGVSHLSFLHSKQLFGEDAQVFRPERWLDSKTDAEHLRTMNSTLDMIFHSGKYQCLGKSVALLEFNKIFVELLRTFDFSVINDEKPARITNAGVWLIKDFWVRVTPFSGTPTQQIEVIGNRHGSASIRLSNASNNGTSDEKKGDIPVDDVKELLNLISVLRGFPSSAEKDIYGADVKVDFNTMEIQWCNGDDDSVGVNEIAGEQKDEFKRVADSIEALARTFAKKDSAV